MSLKVTPSYLRNIRNLSKGETMEFFRQYINPSLKSIEDLCTGVDFCLAMNQLFPNSYDVQKLKRGDNLSERDKRSNFHLLKEAFKASGIKKNFPAEDMMQRNFQSNFYFAQWFVRFFDAHRPRNEEESTDEVICDSPKTETLYTGQSSVHGGARLISQIANAKTPEGTKRNDTILSHLGNGFGSAFKPRPLSAVKSSGYGKLSCRPLKVPRRPTAEYRDNSSQTDEIPFIDAKIECMNQVREEMEQLRLELSKAVRTLQEENQKLLDSLDHSNLKKSYFYKKLDQIENLCLDCPPESLRASLKKILYEEGLPM